MSETVDEQEVILREGVGLKLELTREELSQKATEEGRELGPSDNAVSLLAALHYSQEQEAEYLLRDLATKVLMGKGREGHRAFWVPLCPLVSLVSPVSPCVSCVPFVPLCRLCPLSLFFSLCPLVSPLFSCVHCVPFVPLCSLCPLCPVCSSCPLVSLVSPVSLVFLCVRWVPCVLCVPFCLLCPLCLHVAWGFTFVLEDVGVQVQLKSRRGFLFVLFCFVFFIVSLPFGFFPFIPTADPFFTSVRFLR